MTDNKNVILTELRNLMKKYNITIGFSCDIDNYGETKNDKIIIWENDTAIKEVQGWSINSKDI